MYDLLIIDDLGVERNTEYAMEQMFHVIDCRYRSRNPMIGIGRRFYIRLKRNAGCA